MRNASSISPAPPAANALPAVGVSAVIALVMKCFSILIPFTSWRFSFAIMRVEIVLDRRWLWCRLFRTPSNGRTIRKYPNQYAEPISKAMHMVLLLASHPTTSRRRSLRPRSRTTTSTVDDSVLNERLMVNQGAKHNRNRTEHCNTQRILRRQFHR